MGLDDSESRKSLRVNLLNIVSDGPTLPAKADPLVVPLIQYDPLLHIIGCLQLPSLHPPHLRIVERVSLRYKSSTLQRNSHELLRFVVCYACRINFIVGSCSSYDVSWSSWVERTAEWLNELKAGGVLVGLRVALSAQEIEYALVFRVRQEIFRYSV